MKKVILGFILGVFVMIGTSSYADDVVDQAKELIGQQVQGTFPIFIGDARLKTDSIVVKGKAYVPVRALAEVLNSTVDFVDSTVVVQPKPGTVNTTKLNSLAIGIDDMSQVDKDKLAKWEQEKKANLDKVKAEQDAIDAEKKKQQAADEESARLRAEYEQKVKDQQAQQSPSPAPVN